MINLFHQKNDLEVEELRMLGYTGTISDMQFQYLRDQGYTGALSDMLARAAAFTYVLETRGSEIIQLRNNQSIKVRF